MSFSSFWRKSVNTGREIGLNTSGTAIVQKKLRCTSFNAYFSTFSINSVRWHRIETFYKKYCLIGHRKNCLHMYDLDLFTFLVVRRFTQKDHRESSKWAQRNLQWEMNLKYWKYQAKNKIMKTALHCILDCWIEYLWFIIILLKILFFK